MQPLTKNTLSMQPESYYITSYELATIMNVSERTALRRFQMMRRELGIPPRIAVPRHTVYEFFHIPHKQ